MHHFFQQGVAHIIQSGTVTLKIIQNVSKDLKKLMEKIPQQGTANVGIKQMALYLDAAARSASQTRLTCGYSPSQEVTVLEILGVVQPLGEGTIRHCKRLIEDSSPEEIAAKKKNDDSQAENVESEASSKEKEGGEKFDNVEGTSSTAAKPNEPEDRWAYTYMKVFQCICGFEGRSDEELKVHNRFQHAGKLYCCWGLVKNDDGTTTQCTYSNRDKGQMWQHYRTLHLGLYYLYCPVKDCDHAADKGRYGSDCEDTVRKHMAEKHGIGEAACLCCPNPGCTYIAGAKYLLLCHKQQCDEKDKKVKFYTCDKCQKGFRSHDNFTRHKKQKHPVVPGDNRAWYHCDECPKKFASISSRCTHVKNKHSDPEAAVAAAEAEAAVDNSDSD